VRFLPSVLPPRFTANHTAFNHSPQDWPSPLLRGAFLWTRFKVTMCEERVLFPPSPTRPSRVSSRSPAPALHHLLIDFNSSQYPQNTPFPSRVSPQPGSPFNFVQVVPELHQHLATKQHHPPQLSLFFSLTPPVLKFKSSPFPNKGLLYKNYRQCHLLSKSRSGKAGSLSVGPANTWSSRHHMSKAIGAPPCSPLQPYLLIAGYAERSFLLFLFLKSVTAF